MYEQFKDRAHFYVVYIREAHPSDGWQTGQNERQGIEVEQPKTFGAREKVAQTCSAKLDLSMPFLVDGIDDAVGDAWSGWPDRLFIVDTAGKVAYRGDQGPRGFDVAGMESALERLLSEDALDEALGGGK